MTTIRLTTQNRSLPPEIRNAAVGPNLPQKTPLNLVSSLFGSCACNPFHLGGEKAGESRKLFPRTQYVQLHGVRFIGFGALSDELTPRERVYDTLEQLTTRTDRLVTVGYLIPEENSRDPSGSGSRKRTESVPLDAWNQHFPHTHSLTREVRNTIDLIKVSNSEIS